MNDQKSIAPEEKYDDLKYQKSIKDLKVGDKIVLILTQLDSITGIFIGVKWRWFQRWVGIKAYGSQYVAAAWIKYSEIRTFNFPDDEMFNLYYKFGEINREIKLTEWKNELIPYEGKGKIIIPDNIDTSKLKNPGQEISYGGIN